MSRKTSIVLENIILTFANRLLSVKDGTNKDDPTLGELLDVPVQAILEWHEKQKAIDE